MIGNLSDEAQARTFRDYLYVQGIDNQVETDKDGTWSIWVHSEEDLDRAKDLLAQYKQNPADPKFQNNANAAEQLREQKRQEQAAYEKRVKERRQLFQPMAAYGFGLVTFILIAISVVVFILKSTQASGSINGLFLTRVDVSNAEDIGMWKAFLERVQLINQILPEIRRGEVWRLITPIFIHFTFLHIFFNMLWLRDLGSMIEGRQGSLWFLLLVIVFAALSNLAQYFVSGFGFGGMSGVVYGLVGYIWIRGRLDPGSGLFLHSSTVTMMLIWYFVCLIGFMGAVANTAHLVGLLSGMAWGALSALPHRGKIKK